MLFTWRRHCMERGDWGLLAMKIRPYQYIYTNGIKRDCPRERARCWEMVRNPWDTTTSRYVVDRGMVIVCVFEPGWKYGGCSRDITTLTNVCLWVLCCTTTGALFYSFCYCGASSLYWKCLLLLFYQIISIE